MKRSVALMVMTAAAVGGTGYALTPREDCANRGAVVETAGARCGSGGSLGGGYGSRAYFGSSGSRDNASGGGSGDAAGTTRGGFGSFARAIGAHFGG